jgi:hypothetical protein
VSDAKVLSEYADLSLYIVRQRFTQRKQLKTLDTLYDEKKLPNLAMVVNDVKLKGIRSYYGYGYTYGAVTATITAWVMAMPTGMVKRR